MKKWSWDSNTSEAELRSIEGEMRAELDATGWDSDDCKQLYNDHIDVVNEISIRTSGLLPKREHGWYLSNDD